jgi:hypothetical protein
VGVEMAGVVFTGASIQQQQQTQSAFHVSFPLLSRIALPRLGLSSFLHEFSSLGEVRKRGQNDFSSSSALPLLSILC